MFFFFWDTKEKDDKQCSKCGEVIPRSDFDYHAYNRILYCENCKKEVKREQTRKRVAKHREKKKIIAQKK